MAEMFHLGGARKSSVLPDRSSEKILGRMFFRINLLAAGLLAGTALAPPLLPAKENMPAPPPPKELEGPKPAEGEKHLKSPPPASRKVKIPSAEPRRELKAARVTRPPVVDGSLNDDAWKEAETGGPLVQTMPDSGEGPTERTDFRVVYDDNTLYIGVWCHDSEPDRIVATEMALDGRITSDDTITIALDTFFDRRNGYHLVQYDNVSDTLGYNSRLIWQFRPGANLFIVLNQNIDRENSHLTWLESELTVKVNISFRF